jgi:dihydrodipicolinate reductase
MESTPVKIGLFGYGKMGKTIEGIAQEQGSAEIVWKIDEFNRAELDDARLRTADVVIEFTRPEAAFDNVMLCLRAGIPVVSGTTGSTACPKRGYFAKNKAALCSGLPISAWASTCFLPSTAMWPR